MKTNTYTGKVLLYYKYVALENPQKILKWQRKLCTELGLTGRIIIAREGINGTVGGSTESIDRYRTIMQENELFADVDYKESPGGAQCFPRLRIVVKDEIVHLGIDPAALSPSNGGKHLKPHETHQLLAEKPDDLVIIDCRNAFEAQVGKFKDAIVPPVNHFREFPEYVDTNKELFDNKQVLLYCTGGVRCERATAYVKEKTSAKEVYQMDGGIHRYVEQYPDGFFRGKNYVFDNRIAVRVNDDVIGTCALCARPCDDFNNCLNAECNKHFVCCDACAKQYHHTCSKTCMELVDSNKVKKRPLLEKV